MRPYRCRQRSYRPGGLPVDDGVLAGLDCHSARHREHWRHVRASVITSNRADSQMRRSERRQQDAHAAEQGRTPVRYPGGRFRPLDDAGCAAIVSSALQILSKVGIADTPDWLAALLLAGGARQRVDGRITFEPARVEDAIGRACRCVTLPGSDEAMGFDVGAGRVHLGTGGAAVQVPDPVTGRFRASTLDDLYRMMCVLDRCKQVDYGIRPIVACDMPTPFDLDINTAYACVRATGKPIGVSFHDAEHVAPVIRLFDRALDREDGFRHQPFCMAVIVHVVPPLRFAADGVDVMREAIASGMPLQICSAGQAGATSPASLAGALAQGLAESLAGLMGVDAIHPGHPCIFALMPFVSDLRTGAMSGGSGEAAVASAAAAQLLHHLDLPSTVSAGTTDAKSEDAQAGYEKGYSIALSAHAGADMINLSVGMLGSITVASPDALVVDDDLCAAILRTVRGIEVRDEYLDPAVFERVATGEGHYLGEAETLALMRTEYVYPQLADRCSVEEWVASGQPDIERRAHERAATLYEEAKRGRLAPPIDRAIRAAYDIRLDESMP